ncbi:hypothetical protein Tco_0745325 [Tanacetum coccineum]
MNPQETEQVIARDELWVPTAERVNISTTNVRLETTAFTISADVPEILMQQFWYTITKIKGSESYEFLLADKRCVIDAEVFRKILDICPRKEGEDFTEEDIAYQIDHRWEKKSRRKNMPYPRFTKVIIDYFLSKHKSLKKLKFQHFHTIKDDGVVSRLKFVKMVEDVQQYGLAIPATMLNKEIIQSESYKRFILYSTSQIPPKKSRGKGSQRKKSADPTEESVDVSDESEPEPLIRMKTSSKRVTKKKATISVDDNIVPEPDIALELAKSISLTKAEEEAAGRQVHATHARIVSEFVPEPARRRWRMLGRQPGTGGSDEGTGEIPGVPDESIFADAKDDNEETESDSDDIYKYRINVRKNADTEMKDAEKTADITKETTEQPLTSSSFSVPSDYGNQFLNLSHNEVIFEQPPVLQQTTPIPTTITTTPINTKAPAITTAILEITPFIALQLRVANKSKYSKSEGDNAHMPKILDTTTWFRPILEEERPASPEPEWVIPPIDLPEADNNWANAFAKAHQDPDENKLHNKIDDIGSFIRWYCRRIGKEELSKADLEGPAFMMVKGFHENNISLQFQMEECHKLLTNQIDLVNPEGHRIVPDISNPLPLGGPPGQVTIQPQFFFNKDLEYLLTGDKERNRALSISKLKAALYQDFGLEELVSSLWIESEQVYDISAACGITHWWFSRKQFYINKHSEPSDRDAVRSHMRILSVISIKTYERYGYNYLREIVLRRADYNEYKISEKDFKKDYTIVLKPRAVIYRDRDDNRKMMRMDFKLFKFNKGMENRKWTKDDKRRSEDFIEVIKRRLKIRRIFQSLERFVCGRLRDIDYRLISRTE